MLYCPLLSYIYLFITTWTNIIWNVRYDTSDSCGSVAQAVNRSPPTAEVPSSRLDHPMWVSWWTKRNLGRYFLGFLPASHLTNFIPPFLHTQFIFRFISSALMMVHQAWSAGILAIHRPSIKGTWVEDIIIYKWFLQRKMTIISSQVFRANCVTAWAPGGFLLLSYGNIGSSCSTFFSS